jgi:glycosyltransferase involved in cell wall biosynthesis
VEKSITILLINKFHYMRGGSETYYFGLAEALKAKGHVIVFFSMKDERNLTCEQSEYFIENKNYTGSSGMRKQIQYGMDSIYSKEAKRKLRRLLDDIKPDVAHVNLIHRHLTFSIVDELRKYRIPVVYTIHDMICLCPCSAMLNQGMVCQHCFDRKSYASCVKGKCMHGSLLQSVLGYLEAVFLTRTHRYDKISAYIAPSRFIQSMHQRRAFTRSPIYFMRNFLLDVPDNRTIGHHDGYFLYSGRLSVEKGIQTLVDTIGCLPEARLKIAGTGALLDNIKALITQRGCEDRVELLGYLSRGQLFETVKKSIAVIVPSECYENCPYSVMEAQALGKPVIGANIGGIGELIEDGVTGFLFHSKDSSELADRMAYVMNMGQREYEIMSRKAREFAFNEYDHKRYVSALTALYVELVKREGRK